MRNLAALALGFVLFIFASVTPPLLFPAWIILIITTIYLFGTTAQVDRRYRTGYKYNKPPTPINQKFKYAKYGYIVGGLLFVGGIVATMIAGSSNENKPKSTVTHAIINTVSGLNLRTDSIKDESNVIMLMPSKDTVELLFKERKYIKSSNDKWIKIKYKDKEGWVVKKFLKPIED